ncbi:MAG: sodium:calcium antiporter [Alphaproteobacteria bacterium]
MPGWTWLQFAACAALIGAAGPVLSRSGDIIAEKTGLSRGWVGLILLATVTSLPELATGISAVTVAGSPDIAVGDALGSCVFNLAILVVLDLMHRDGSLFHRARQGHILSAAFGTVLIGFVAMSLLLARQGLDWRIGHVGLSTPIIMALYAVAARTLFRYEARDRESFAEQVAESYPGITLASAVRRYAVAALVVVAAGIWLPFVGEALAEEMGWRRSFVGTLLVAAITSLPELVVAVAAARFGALDMAVASLLGSNLFDILIIAVDDVAYPGGPLLAAASPAHAVTAASAVVMTGIVVIGLLYRPQGRVFRAVGWVGLGLFTVYVLNAYVLFLNAR